MVTSVKDIQSTELPPIIPTETIQASKTDISSVNFNALSLDDDIEAFTLREAYDAFVLDLQGDIPFLIWLLENPNSALALPGKVDLHGHDCIHLLLNRGKSNFDEAFVIGFTMGNSSEIKEHHFKIFRTFATRFYPAKYRFNRYHMKAFEQGVTYGESLNYKNINLVNFELYVGTSIKTLRDSLGISIEDIRKISIPERIWVQQEALGL